MIDEPQTVLVVGSMRSAIGNIPRLLLREIISYPGVVIRNDTHATQRFAAVDDRKKIDPRHNKKLLPRAKWLQNYR
jgi:hypothetical protein